MQSLRVCRHLPLIRPSLRRSWSAAAGAVCRHRVPVCQGGAMFLKLDQVKTAHVEVTSAWIDHCEVEHSSECPVIIRVDEQSGCFEVFPDSSKPLCDTYAIKISVPEYFDSTFSLNHAQLDICKKIKGNMHIQCQSGSINVEKVKGSNITFDCNNADIQISNVIEGDVQISARNLSAAMINGHNVNVKCTKDIFAKAIYGEHTCIDCGGDVTVDLARGKMKIVSDGSTTMSNIDGSVEADSQFGDITLQINKLYQSSASFAQAPQGSVHVLVDPELPLHLVGRREGAEEDLKDSFDDENRMLSVKSDSFHGFIKSDLECSGYFSGVSDAVKRPEFTKRKSRSGKINIHSADIQSLSRLNSSEQRVTATLPSDDPQTRPRLLVTAKNKIRVETESWIGRIRKKYGFDS